MLGRIRSLFQVLRFRGSFERNMAEELRFHIDQYTADLVCSGLSPEEAARRARVEFGGMNSAREDCRGARGLHPFDELNRQLRQTFRTLRRTPRFTVTALVTLAVCLGANLAIFAVVDAILLRPLPFPQPDRLVTVYNTYPKAGVPRDGSSTTNYYERRGRIPAFSSLAIYREASAIVGEAGATVREPVMRVSPEFFTTLGTAPAIGRSFRDEEMSPQADRSAIVSDDYWRRNLNADPHVIGRQMRVDGINRTIVGILPPGFRFLSSEANLYFPFVSGSQDRLPSERHSGGNSKHIIARLAPNATLEQAQAQIDSQNNSLAPEFPRAQLMADAGFRSIVAPLHADHVAVIRPVLLWMQIGAFVLLLIGAVNLANLLLVRAAARTKELAVRQALGASRRHVIIAATVETLVLTTAGAALGLLAGWGGMRFLAALGTNRLPLGSQIIFEPRLALVAMLGAVFLAILLALPIVWFHLRARLNGAIQAETRGGTSNQVSQNIRHGFIVAQIGLALVLLSGAGLLRLSLQHIMAVAPGFQPDHVLTARLLIPGSGYPNWAARLAFDTRLFTELSGRPGVLAAGIVTNIPVSGDTGKSSATVKGRVPQRGETVRAHYSYGVDGDYFTAMGFSLVEGRFLNAAHSRRPDRICVVDSDFARYYWPHGSALGQQLFEGGQQGTDAEAFTVIGVVGAVKQAGLTDDAAQGAVYYPYPLRGDDRAYIAVRTSVAPQALGQELRTIVRQVGRDVTLYDLSSMDARIADTLTTRRAPALMAAIFSTIALLLTAIGTYGVLSYAVQQRRREIGIRIALGARTQQIRRQFLMAAFRLLLAGTIVGLTGAWLTGRAMRNLLFQVAPFHVLTFVEAAGVIAAVSLIACLAPAVKAARVSPMEALRDDR